MNIFERVSNWNEARYPQVYNWKLQLSLLTEELEEFLTAETEVDKLDALCDISFVALGGLWKAGLKPCADERIDTEVTTCIDECTSATEAVQFLQNTLSNYDKMAVNLTSGDHYLLNTVAFRVAELIMHNEYDLDLHRSIIALSIVCDSNDSKAVKKTDPSIKANIDKGVSFVPPEARLQALLDTRWTGA